MDINPGHVLVVPKIHATDLFDLSPEIGGRTFQVAQKLANALMISGVKCDGVNLMLAHKEAAGQEVFHVHLHIIPCYKNDNLKIKIKFGNSKKKPTRADLLRSRRRSRPPCHK